MAEQADPTRRGSMTGLSRSAVAMTGLAVAIVAIVAAEILVGAVNLCGLGENQVATGYCAASEGVRGLLAGLPILTVTVGYAISLRSARLTPVALAACCAVAEGAIALVGGL
jgi:hypothetical protein